jgi:hypothetical protein
MTDEPTYEELCQSTDAKLVYNPINYAWFWYGDNVYCFAHESPHWYEGEVLPERWVLYHTYTFLEFCHDVAERGLKGVNLSGWKRYG